MCGERDGQDKEEKEEPTFNIHESFCFVSGYFLLLTCVASEWLECFACLPVYAQKEESILEGNDCFKKLICYLSSSFNMDYFFTCLSYVSRGCVCR